MSTKVLSETEYKEAEIFLLLKYGTVENIIDSYINVENDKADEDMMADYLAHAAPRKSND